MRKPITVLFTDLHIKQDNTEEIISVVKEVVEYCHHNKVDEVFCLGDVFHSRQAQPLQVLQAFKKIITLFRNQRITVNIIPGNHDKTDYQSEDSFLDLFDPSPYFNLIANQARISFGVEEEYNFYLIPFFSEELWIKKFNLLFSKEFPNKKMMNFLLSHTAMDGSVNNDGSLVKCSINPSNIGEHFHKVFLGHYHNQQQIGDNIYHIPSIRQNNFGEDTDKGFTVLYDDGSHELIRTNFKQFINHRIELTNLSKKKLQAVLDTISNDDNNRIILKGTKEELKSIDLQELRAKGHKVIVEELDIEVKEIISIEQLKLDSTNITEEFKIFCQNNDLSYEIGINYLTKHLENGSKFR